MAISGFLFLSWRIFELIILLPPVGMLSWFVHRYVVSNLITPDYILVMFIVSVLALAWVFFTVVAYLRARHDALFVAFIDLGFVGAFIAAVYYLRGFAGANCSSFGAGDNNGHIYVYHDTNKACAMLKASFAFGILNILAFIVTFFLALLVYHHHRKDDQVVVKREYRHSHHGGRHRSSSRGDHRSRSGRSEYDRGEYGYGNGPQPHSSRRSHRSSSRRRQYYV